MREAHCTVCHAHFRNTEAFDAHLTTDACAPPATFVRQDGRPRFRERQTKWGPMWALASYRDLPEHWDTDSPGSGDPED